MAKGEIISIADTVIGGIIGIEDRYETVDIPFPVLTDNDNVKNGPNVIYGTSDRDVLYGHDGDDNIRAFEGDDLIRGCAGNDKINGGLGDDEIFGGAGNDFILGGAGKDAFIFEENADLNGRDIIMDFEVGADELHFMCDYGNKIIITQDGNNSDIYYGDHVDHRNFIATLKNVNPNDLTEANFVGVDFANDVIFM